MARSKKQDPLTHTTMVMAWMAAYLREERAEDAARMGAIKTRAERREQQFRQAYEHLRAANNYLTAFELARLPLPAA